MHKNLMELLVDFLKEQGIEEDDINASEYRQLEETAEILAEWTDDIRSRVLSASIEALADVDSNGIPFLSHDAEIDF